jgi:hypothetical protein
MNVRRKVLVSVVVLVGGCSSKHLPGAGENPDGELAGVGGTAGAGGATGSGGVTMAGASGSLGTGGAAGAAGGEPTSQSSGCGKAPPAALTSTGKWVVIADGAKADGYTGGLPSPDPAPISVTGPDGKTYDRGFYVFVPTTYDQTKPTRVIYEGAGCTDTGMDDGEDAGGASGYPYQNVDATNAGGEVTIQVGIQYDPTRGGCYDDQNPMSNDFAFFPILHHWVEQSFCVDLKRQFFSGYNSGARLANQMTCAFPDVLRGVAETSGGEPSAQPTCVTSGHPVASIFLHNINDTVAPFAGSLPACSRILGLNGCSMTSCTPSDTSVTTPYTPPTFSAEDGAPTSLSCRQFNGCPTDAPVVFCTISSSATAIRDDAPGGYPPGGWLPKLFWDFFSKL